jgi:NAD+ kinase
MTVAIYGKHIESVYLVHLKYLITTLQNNGIDLICEEGFAHFLKKEFDYVPNFSRVFGKESLSVQEVTMLLSIGGDGTFLDSAVYVKDEGVPVLGVNMGRLGFLATAGVDEIEKTVSQVIAGGFSIQERDMLTLQVNGNILPGFDYALNEIAVLKASTSSLLNIHAYIKDVYLTTYWADGLVVATPTGSTAYSMSGGGPIVCPECQNIILTPICPHNLTIRPLVVPNDTEIVLQVESRTRDFVLGMDSRMRKMDDIHQLTISPSVNKMKVVNLDGHNYYETLRNKLMWGEDRRNGSN